MMSARRHQKLVQHLRADFPESSASVRHKFAQVEECRCCQILEALLIRPRAMDRTVLGREDVPNGLAMGSCPS